MATVTEQTRHFTASAVVLDPIRECVLLVEHKATGRWQFPGGHVDPDESGHQCALREVMEETGVRAGLWVGPSDAVVVPGGRRHVTPLMVCEFPAPAKPHKGEPPHHHIDLLYLATADSAAQLLAQEAEVHGAAWFPLAGLDTADVRPDVPVAARMAWDLVAATDVATAK